MHTFDEAKLFELVALVEQTDGTAREILSLGDMKVKQPANRDGITPPSRLAL